MAMHILKDKVAVVVGCSARSGSGWAIAERFAEEGARLILGARRVDQLAELAEKTGGIAMSCDVADERQVEELAARALSEFGRLDLAVNAAGYAGPTPVASAPRADFQRNLDVNYFGNIHFIRHMAAGIGQNGSIVILSSLSATHPMLPLAGYAASKAAVDCLIRHAALEYGDRGIRINSIQPGPIRSEMTADAFSSPGPVAALEKETPLGRIADPDDIADAVLWLASSPFMTGAGLPIAGGLQLARFPTPEEFSGA